MFHEVDSALRSFLGTHMPPGTNVSFETPSPTDEAHRRGEVTLFLYDVREDPSGRGAGWSDIRNADHLVVGRKLPNRRYQLSYLVSTRAATAEEAHRLLGQTLAALVTIETLPTEHLDGALAASTLPVEVRVAATGTAAAAHDLWSALHVPPRACLDLVITAPLIPDLIVGVEATPGVINLDMSPDAHTSPPAWADPFGTANPPRPTGKAFTTVRVREKGVVQRSHTIGDPPSTPTNPAPPPPAAKPRRARTTKQADTPPQDPSTATRKRPPPN
ncbi:DUF4255 domain-containing protein (plasmid) [Kitasatospora sp. NBC_00070]|uniref:DUF4255 domain-containing protein n=1 Tax=Kitasatospora sp. NBC_00070 TaxID=2975962 RepID=UPI002F90CC1C